MESGPETMGVFRDFLRNPLHCEAAGINEKYGTDDVTGGQNHGRESS